MIDVVLPVLNEAEALPWVISRIPAGYRPLVVDNGSSDGSGEIAADLGCVVVREPRPGFGAACFAGLESAASDVVCFLDCDGSLDPAQLPLVADPVRSGDADLVLGARNPVVAGAWPLHARLGNRVIARRLRRRWGVSVTDLGPMRAASRCGLLELGITDRRFGWPLEMVVRAAVAGWRVQEVAVSYHPRRGGRSKVTGSLRGSVRAARDMARIDV